MQKVFLKLILVLFLCTTSQISFSQLLWKVEKEGFKTSYLLGTMHLSDDRVFENVKQYTPYLEKTTQFIGEVIVDDNQVLKMLSQLYMRDQITLKSLLPDDEFQYIKAHIDQKLSSMKEVSVRLKPFFLFYLLTEEDIKHYSQQEPLDIYLKNYALRKGLKVTGLESFLEQMATYDAIPLPRQAKMLYDDLKSQNNEHKDKKDKLITAYQNENLDLLYRISIHGMSEELYKVMLTERNNRMTYRIIDHIKKESSFIAVGATHLTGKTGIIPSLRKKGFTVSPVKM